MKGNRPRRRKDKFNPYTLIEHEGRYRVVFFDGQVQHDIEIEKPLFDLFNAFELEDLSFLNEVERHYDRALQDDAYLGYRRIAAASGEEAAMQRMEAKRFKEALNSLTESQRRRVKLYFFDGLTYEAIGRMEGCKYQTIQESIALALKKIKKRNFWNSTLCFGI